jgi:hypothetical protein
MRGKAVQRGLPGTMNTEENSTTDQAAIVAPHVEAQGAHVAPEKAHPRKGRDPEERCSQRQESRQEQGQDRPEGSQPQAGAQGCPNQGGWHSSCRKQGREGRIS